MFHFLQYFMPNPTLSTHKSGLHWLKALRFLSFEPVDTKNNTESSIFSELCVELTKISVGTHMWIRGSVIAQSLWSGKVSISFHI